MPKRIGNIADKIYDRQNIEIADNFARKGKKQKYGVIKHDRNRDEENKQLSEMLKNNTIQVSEYNTKVLREPCGGKIKERVLKKLPYFPDRIWQWSMMLQLVPIWDKLFINSTYSCIVGRGIHACAEAVKKALKEDTEGTKYCLKLDIKKCYDSVDNKILFETLQKKLKDPLVLWWLNKIVFSTEGIPIGSYTSQYFINIFLCYFDHYCKEILHIKYYFRYADDITIFAETKEQLHKWFQAIRYYLEVILHLTIKENWQIFPVDDRGVDFVGYVFYHGYTKLRKSIKKKLLTLVERYKRGEIEREEFNRKFASYKGWLKYCNSKNLLQKIESETGIHVSNWNGKKTTFREIENKSIYIVELDKHKSYFTINFVYKHKPYYIESKNKKLLETLPTKTNYTFYDIQGRRRAA